MDVLDNPIWAALTGPHARLAQVHGQAARYPPDVSPFVGLPDGAGEQAWRDLAELVAPGELAVIGNELKLPDGWELTTRLDGVQLVDVGLDATDDPEAVVLTDADRPDMLDLAERTEPGPFLPRTNEMGTYLGIRRDGRLVAMAGERLHPPGWTEISAVCTDEAYRGQGLAGRLIRAVAAGIRRRDETPFLHAAASNTNAIRLYESMGFRLRRRVAVTFARVTLG